MKGMDSTIRLVAHLCVALVLLPCVLQPTIALPFALLIPFWFFISLAPLTFIPPVTRLLKPFPSPELPVFSPRSPPTV
jgi:hypothetical protein